jgi:hypothetical protein
LSLPSRCASPWLDRAKSYRSFLITGQFQNALAGPTGSILPFNHLAYEALLFVPFSLLKYRPAYVAFFVINLILLAVCYRLLRPKIAALAELWTSLPLVLFACYFPVAVALAQGQDSIILLTLLIAALTFLERGHALRAGLCVGLTLFKFQFTLPILVLFLAWRWWRAVAGCVLASVAAAALSLRVTGVAMFEAYLRSLISMSTSLNQVQEQRYLIHPESMPNLRGALCTLAGHHVPNTLVQTLIIICSGLLLLFAARARPSFPLAVAVAVLVSYHGLIHDAVLLIIPLGLFVASSLDGDSALKRWTTYLSAVVLVAPTLLMLGGGYTYFLMALPILGMVLTGGRVARTGPVPRLALP